MTRPAPPFDAVLFDLDGVVIDSEPLHEEAMRRTFRRLELAVPLERFREFKGTAERDTFALVAREYARGRFTGPEINEAKQTLYAAGLPDVPFVAGFPAYAELLREKGIPAALVTSATRANTGTVIDSRGLGDLFRAVVTAEDVERAKPDPEPYRTGARRLRLPPEKCLVIEDAERGIESARAAGCPVAGLATTLDPEDLRAAGCDWVAADFDRLRSVMGWP